MFKTNDAAAFFAGQIRKRCNLEFYFNVMSILMLLDSFDWILSETRNFCANSNKSSFRMSGGIEVLEKNLHGRRFLAIGTSVFPPEAWRFVEPPNSS